MITINKTTHQIALNRGLSLTLEHGLTDDGSLLVCFWEVSQDSEWILSYRSTPDGLVFNGNVYAPDEVRSKMPAVLVDEQALRLAVRILGESEWLSERREEEL